MLSISNEKKAFVFLDLDDTVFDFGKAEKMALSKMLTALGIEPTAELLSRYSEINVKQWELLERGDITREQVLSSRFEMLFREFEIEKPAGEANAMYEKLLGIGHYYMPGAQQLIKDLNGKYKLYIASNGAAGVQAGRLSSAGIERYFNGIFISENMGFDKPRKEYFERCFEQIPDFRRDRAIIVGDSLTSDIKGGKNAGILTCWFNPKNKAPREDIKPDFEIKDLDALPALLDGIFG